MRSNLFFLLKGYRNVSVSTAGASTISWVGVLTDSSEISSKDTEHGNFCVTGHLILLPFLLLLLRSPLQAQDSPLYQDVYLQATPDQLTFGNQYLTLIFDRQDGQWLSLTRQGLAENIIHPSDTIPTLDFTIDGVWLVARHGATFSGYQTALAPDRSSVTLALAFVVAADADSFLLTQSFMLPAGESWLERSATLTSVGDGAPRKMEDFQFVLPGVAVGNPQACVVNVPGPWFPRSYVPPNTPYETFRERDIPFFHGAPDAGFGVFSITNPSEDITLTTWMRTGGEVNYHPDFKPRPNTPLLDFMFQDHRAYRMPGHRMPDHRMPGHRQVQSDVQKIVITEGSLMPALEQYQQMCEQDMPLDKNTPDWVQKMVLLEIYPSYFPGGFQEITQRLPYYRQIGFNTIYLMPHWKGGYSPIDLRAVNPEYGTQADLQALVKKAHQLGMKVLFDMVIHGFDEDSPMMEQHPEYFVHDAQGQITRHRTWKSMSTDWASPAYQQFMVDLVLHDLALYDIDGYRVDAASYKGPSWEHDLPYPAYRSGTAAPVIMEKMITALRQKKPASVLLSEVFGPVFYTVSNLAHDNNTEGPQLFLEKWKAGEVTARDYKLHMLRVFQMLPPGANRVFYARNHDTSWFYHFNGYTPAFMALEAIHTFCAIPEVFAGDRDRKREDPNPDTAVLAHYQKLFRMKEAIPELSTGALLLDAVEADQPNVFTAIRQSEQNTYLVIVSMSKTAQKVNIKLDSAQVSSPAETVTLKDPLTGESQPVSGTLQLEVKPFQVLVGKL